MGLFGRRGDREGAGLPLPEGGIRRYGVLLATHFWKLVELNLLFILFSIPIVTLPAALCGVNRVCVLLIRNGYCFVWGDFWEEFRRSFRRSLFPALLFALLRKVVHREAAACARTHSQQRVKASLLACEDALTAEKYAALHHVSQLAHVALPVVALQQSEEFWRDIL